MRKLHADAADFALLREMSTDPDKRELFGRLADELAIEALELEQATKMQGECVAERDSGNVVTLKLRIFGGQEFEPLRARHSNQIRSDLPPKKWTG